MGMFNIRGMLMPIIAVCVVGFAMGNDQKISGKIDVVFVAPGTRHWRTSLSTLIEAWKKHLLEQVEMGKDTKIAVVVYQCSGHPKFLVNLTNDRTAAQNALNQWTAACEIEAQGQGLALAMIRDQIFDFRQSDRAKVVILFLRFGGKPQGLKQAEILRQRGAFSYYIYATTGQNYHDLPGVALKQTGSASRVFNQSREDMFSIKAFDRIPDIISAMTSDLCTFCHFEDAKRVSCIAKVRKPGMIDDFFGDGHAKCQKLGDPSALQCDVRDNEECRLECNRNAPWDDARPCHDPDKKPCVDRHGRTKQFPPSMENCQKEIKCNWTCPTTTTTVSTVPAVPTPPSNIQDKTSKPDDSKLLPLIITVVVIVIVLIIVIVAVVVLSRRSRADKMNALENIEKLKKKRAEDKAKHKHHVVTAGAKKGVRDAMAVSLVSTMEPTKRGQKSMTSPSKIGGGKSMASSSKVGGKSLIKKAG